jgi:hypothetical protein
MTLFQTTVYELTAIEGTSVTLKFTTEQTAPPQSVSGLVPGMDAKLESFAGSGGGTIAMRLDDLASTVDLSIKVSTAMSIDMGGAPQAVGSEATTRITVKPVK